MLVGIFEEILDRLQDDGVSGVPRGDEGVAGQGEQPAEELRAAAVRRHNARRPSRVSRCTRA